MITEQDINDLTDAVSNDVDEWVRAGGGTFDELEDIIERAIRRIVTREGGPDA